MSNQIENLHHPYKSQIFKLKIQQKMLNKKDAE